MILISRVKMYQWAHQKDPSLQLFVNDYAIISNPGKQVEAIKSWFNSHSDPGQQGCGVCCFDPGPAGQGSAHPWHWSPSAHEQRWTGEAYTEQNRVKLLIVDIILTRFRSLLIRKPSLVSSTSWHRSTFQSGSPLSLNRLKTKKQDLNENLK